MFDDESFDTGAFSVTSWLFDVLLSAGGTVTFSGVATLLKGAMLPAGGTVELSGTAGGLLSSLLLSASGTVLFSGSAPLNFQSALGGGARQLPLVGVGQ